MEPPRYEARLGSLREGAVLHRRIQKIVGAIIALCALQWALGFSDWAWAVIGVMFVLYLALLVTAYRLGEWLCLGGLSWVAGLLVPCVNVLVLCRLLWSSTGYFRSKGIRVGILGPDLGDVSGRGEQSARVPR